MLRALLMCALRRGLDEDEGGEGKCSENNLIVAALGTLDVALLSHFEVHNSSFLDMNIETSPVDVRVPASVEQEARPPQRHHRNGNHRNRRVEVHSLDF